MAWIPRGSLIKRLRALLGWSQEVLAERAGVSLKTVRRAESRTPQGSLRGDGAQKLAGAFQSAFLPEPEPDPREKARRKKGEEPKPLGNPLLVAWPSEKGPLPPDDEPDDLQSFITELLV